MGELNSLVKSFASMIFSPNEANEFSADLSSYEIPEIRKGVTPVKFRGLTVLREGDSLSFGSFTHTIIIDKNLEIYNKLYKWFYRGKDFDSTNVTELYDSAKLLIFRPDNDNKKLRAEIWYRNIKILRVGAVKIDFTVPEPFMRCDCEFMAEEIKPKFF